MKFNKNLSSTFMFSIVMIEVISILPCDLLYADDVILMTLSTYTTYTYVEKV